MKKVGACIIFCIIAVVVIEIGQNIFAGEPYKSKDTKKIEKLHQMLNEKESHLVMLSQEKVNLQNMVEQIKKEKDRLEKQDIKKIEVLNNEMQGKLKGKAEAYLVAGKIYNVNPIMMVAISMHETANGTSKMIKNQNNVGGFYYNGFLNFKSVDESIFYMARLLKSEYIDKGLTNIELIGSKYCPIGAGNDPTGLNVHWVPRVTEIYLDLYNQTGGAL